MKTELKEVIHLYLGCEVETTARSESSQGKRMGYKTGRMLEIDIRCETVSVDIDDVPVDFKFHEVLPILRPLSDMTEEEADKLGYGDKYEFMEMVEELKPIWQLQMEDFLYLLKQGFDLFGLIDSGQAINKNSIN